MLIINYFSCFSIKTYVVGTQKNRLNETVKNRLNETVLLSTQNIMFRLMGKKLLQLYAENVYLSGPMILGY